MSSKQAPYFYRFTLGDAEGTVVSDGPMNIGPPRNSFQNIAATELDGIFHANFLTTDRWDLEQNILVLKIGGRTVLFETGFGSAYLKLDYPNFANTNLMMPTLAQAGIDPASIDTVVISHAHVDHCGGILDDSGNPNFPNAEILLAKEEYDYFADNPSGVGPNFDCARRTLRPVRDRIRFIRDGEEVLPGITAIVSPGHSPAHMMFSVRSGDDHMILTGDMVHDYAALLARPEANLAFDYDGPAGATTRRKYLEMLARDRTLILSYHFPWPGIGYIVKDGDGYRFQPRPMKLV